MIRELILSLYFTATGMPVYQHLFELKTFASATPKLHKSLVENKLLRAIRYAVDKVSYYRDCGFKNISDFPVLTKQLILDNFQNLIANPFKKKDGIEIYTSGSTGRRLKILYDRLEHGWRTATVWYGLSLPSEVGGANTPIFSGIAYLGGEPDKSGGFIRVARRVLRDRFLKQTIFGCYNLTPEKSQEIYRTLSISKPAIILGYACNLERIARFISERELPRIKAAKVVSTAEQLTSSALAQIKLGFDAPVRERYGCGEVGGIAVQCEYGNWHIFSPHIYAEVLLEDGTISSSGTGRLLITKLNNRIMPLVRYDIEDIVELASNNEPLCPCGRALPVIKRLLGREIDLIYLENGETIHGLSVAETLEGVPVKEFVFAQTDSKKAEFYIVPRKEFNDDWLNKVRKNVDIRFCRFLDVSIKVVEEIPSEIASPFGNGKRLQVYNMWRRKARKST